MKKIFTLAACAALHVLSNTATAQSWQSVQSSNTSAFSLASTKNGYVFTYKPGQLFMSADGMGQFTLVPNTPAVNWGTLYGWKQMLFILDEEKGMRRSLDYGVTWQFVNSGMLSIDSTNLRKFIPMGGNHAVILHNGSAVNKVFTSSDNGATWSANLNLTSSHVGIDVVAKGSDWYLFTNSTVYKSDDNGQNWNNLNVTLPDYGGKVQVLSDGTFIMRPSTDIYTSPDAITWTPLSSTGIPAMESSRQLIKSPTSDTLFITTEILASSTYNVYYSADKGVTWSAYNTGLPANARIANDGTLMIAHNGYMFASPVDMDIYRTGSPVSASTVGVQTISKKHAGFSLFPNPATDKLQVSYSCTGASSIEVVDVTGRILLVHQAEATKVKQEHYINTSALAPGFYTLSVKTNAGIMVENFVKQ